MKTLIVYSLMFITSVVGCDPEDINPNTDNSIDGTWNLTHVSGGIDGRNLTFDTGVIVWTFNEETGMVTIVNSSDNGLSVFQSGTYSFLIEEMGGHKTISINGMDFGIIDISADKINIDQEVADGIFLELTK